VAEHDVRAVAFPTLAESQIATLERCAPAALRHYRDGEALFNAAIAASVSSSSGPARSTCVPARSSASPRRSAGAMAVQFVHEYLKER